MRTKLLAMLVVFAQFKIIASEPESPRRNHHAPEFRLMAIDPWCDGGISARCVTATAKLAVLWAADLPNSLLEFSKNFVKSMCESTNPMRLNCCAKLLNRTMCLTTNLKKEAHRFKFILSIDRKIFITSDTKVNPPTIRARSLSQPAEHPVEETEACANVPFVPLIKLCLKMYELKQTTNGYHVCFALSAKFREKPVKSVNLECLRTRTDGMHRFEEPVSRRRGSLGDEPKIHLPNVTSPVEGWRKTVKKQFRAMPKVEPNGQVQWYMVY